MQDIIYLDHNSTTPPLKEVKNYLLQLEVFDLPLNPSSVHLLGRQAKNLLEEARVSAKKSIGAMCHELIFCSSATECINLCFNALEYANIFALATDHECAINHPKTQLLPVDKDGLADLCFMEQVFKKLPQNSLNLLSFCLANNQSGVLQNFDSLVTLCKQHGVLLHGDASQFAGKDLVDLRTEAQDFDFLTIAGHKFGSIHGSACLVYKSGIDFKPLMFGGGQEKFKRPSTQNLPAALALSKALELVNNQDYLNKYQNHCNAFRTELESFLQQNNCIIFGKGVPRVANTTFFAMPGFDNNVQMIEYDLANICVSNGSACSSSKVSLSHVLTACSVPKELARCAVRVSCSLGNTTTHLQTFKAVFTNLAKRLEAN